MSQSSKILSIEECQVILQRWQREGLTEEEHMEFVESVSTLLSDSTQVSELEESIRESAVMAKDINEGFFRQESYLQQLVNMWPTYTHWYTEWVPMRVRWQDCLRLSIELAMETSDVLQRFDTIYLAQVENIQTEQDRLAAIAALDSLMVDLNNKDRSAEMSRKFLDLRRDVAAFAEKVPITMWSEVVQINKNIEVLDAQVKSVQNLIGPLGERRVKVDAGYNVSNVIASLQTHRKEQANGLKTLYQAVTNINMMVAPRVQQSSQNLLTTGLAISYWPDHLLEFAEIWASIRSQNVQFSSHIKGGLDAATNTRFRAEVRLAREVCTPLRAALTEYKQQLQGLL